MMQSYREVFTIIDKFRLLFSQKDNNISSAIVYGSVSRQEFIAGKSDIDMLVLLKNVVISEETASWLSFWTNSLSKEYKIKIHLRIRHPEDLIKRTSGMNDCGFTSSINKLRDSILFFGNPLDDCYISYIKSASIIDIEANIRQRMSEERYQVRSLVSVDRNEIDFNYRLGCLICQLAELVCYSKGVFFINSFDALQKVQRWYQDDFFSKAFSIKQGVIDIDFFQTLSRMDFIINDATLHIDQKKLNSLKRVRYSAECINNNNYRLWCHWRETQIIPPELSLRVKSSEINSHGELVISEVSL
jgi:predicted nucleotidyltransferase